MCFRQIWGVCNFLQFPVVCCGNVLASSPLDKCTSMDSRSEQDQMTCVFWRPVVSAWVSVFDQGLAWNPSLPVAARDQHPVRCIRT